MIALRPRRVAAIVLRQGFLLRGSPARFLPLFAWVAIDIVLWGFITRYLDAITRASIRFVPLLLGAFPYSCWVGSSAAWGAASSLAQNCSGNGLLNF